MTTDDDAFTGSRAWQSAFRFKLMAMRESYELQLQQLVVLIEEAARRVSRVEELLFWADALGGDVDEGHRLLVSSADALSMMEDRRADLLRSMDRSLSLK